LTACPSCGGEEFLRASIFNTEPIAHGEDEPTEATLVQPAADDLGARLEQARARIESPGEYLLYEEGEELLTVPLNREWTRIGRSLAADLRFDDPTVSRRHALIVRHPDGVRLLDDRSLNGVFVNGARIDGRVLEDGDEIIVGRYRLCFMRIETPASTAPPAGSGGAGSASSVG
jgi:pSer/pThr/pTyr-binding forkhead associated (FHA) protein